MKKQDANARREELRKLSKQLKDSNKIAVARGVRVNDLLIDYYNEAFKTTELNTYEQWKNRGYQVKKGSQSYMVWATPRDIKVKDKRLTDNTETEKEIKDYFAVCHLFDVSQVAPIQTKQN